MSLEQVRATALKASTAAGDILKEKLGRLSCLDYKSAYNIVTEADKASEAAVIAIIRETFPDHQILGEESGAHKTDSEHRWLIDPLDGTTNYAHSYPFFCVSIGFEDRGEMVFGMVFNPLTGERFHAEKGKGAYIGEHKIACSSTKTLNESLLATGFPPDSKNSPKSNMREFQFITDHCHGVRRDGSAALDLCFVASGRLDGFWEFKLAPWDLAAGTIIVREAGGKISSPEGGAFDINTGHVIASNGYIHDEIVSSLAHCRKSLSAN